MNKTLQLGIFTAAVALVTSGLVSASLAGYTTTTSSSDSARAAVWGINETPAVMDLFAPGYEGKVVSANGDNIIAPGTSGSSRFSILNVDQTFAPETKYEISVDTSRSVIDPLIADNPSIQFRLDNGAWGTWDQLMQNIRSLSGHSSGKKVYEAGQIAQAFATGKTHEIQWKWEKNGNDLKDTQLGNEAAARNLPIDLIVSVTATQVD